MARSSAPIPKDIFHRLQDVGPRPTPRSAPFVGNATIDDNIAECVQITLWNLNPDLHARVHAEVSDGYVTLRGEAGSPEERGEIEAAIFEISGIVGITNQLKIGTVSPLGHLDRGHRAQARPMLYVTRHAGLEAASLSAAVKQALDTLDGFLEARGRTAPTEAIVIYHSRINDMIAIDVGYPVSADLANAATGEIKAGVTPAGLTLSVVPAPGVEGLIEAIETLSMEASANHMLPAFCFWQVVPKLKADHLADRAGIALQMSAKCAEPAAPGERSRSRKITNRV